MWQCIDELDVPKDYLQAFKCAMYDGKQKIKHIQEELEYQREYLFNTDTPVFVGKGRIQLFLYNPCMYSINASRVTFQRPAIFTASNYPECMRYRSEFLPIRRIVLTSLKVIIGGIFLYKKINSLKIF